MVYRRLTVTEYLLLESSQKIAEDCECVSLLVPCVSIIRIFKNQQVMADDCHRFSKQPYPPTPSLQTLPLF